MTPSHTTPEAWAKLRSLYGLQEIEKWWVEHQPFLLSRGYALRPCYHPIWTPTWELPGNEDEPCYRFEDSIPIGVPGNVLDAVRIVDNVKVVLKLVRTTQEMDLAWYLGEYLPTTEPDPWNRCAPLLEKLDFEALNIKHEQYKGLLVFPFLRQFDDPPFRQLREVTEAVGQFLQAAEYMHAKNVAHRDFCSGNLMMDASRVVSCGWHFEAPWTRCGKGEGIKSVPRSTKTYLLDVGKYGQDKTVPELSGTVPYNPFKVDIYQLGNVIMELIETYEGLEIFRELAEVMTRKNPAERPTASECVELFHDLVSTISEDAPHLLAGIFGFRRRGGRLGGFMLLAAPPEFFTYFGSY
ncbi:Protein kinase domain-containing protein [Mycena sanguinolenta]|uniref:Protein kinase domain-containing protein n=1 Tax=Mycena sanguinolenta TaxID=230812 RepID=A0A8H6X716_9AGAR|nr:Protein kinase domain-containing protein [Mycena sanguinolenta]